MGPGSGSAVTPLNVDITVQGRRGAAHIQPISIGNSILYIQYGAQVVRDFAYKLESDGYSGNDLTILANHLFSDRAIVDWSYQRTPYSIVWCVMSDGAMTGLTYNREQEIWGWHRHDTTGEFEAVATIPAGQDAVYGSDETMFIVKRTINGVTKRYIEKQMPRFIGGVEESKNGFFVDCGLYYDGAATSTLTGLDHLEGEAVAVLADGNVIPGITVVSGGITLPYEASLVIVGLGYASDLGTMELEIPADGQTLQDRYRGIKEVTVQLENTRACFVGPDKDHLTEIDFREEENWDEAIQLYTGTKQVSVESSSDAKSAKVFIRNTDPVPMTVLSIIPRLTIGQL